MDDLIRVRVQTCLVPNCGCRSDEHQGRIICVEPDDDGWICEPCWTFLTKSTGRLNQLYRNGKAVAEQRQRDRDHYYAGQARSLSPVVGLELEWEQLETKYRGGQT